jgi:hypothetical protein
VLRIGRSRSDIADDRTRTRGPRTADIGVESFPRSIHCVEGLAGGRRCSDCGGTGDANNASALAETWLSIRIRTNDRIAAGLADVPPVATPESSRLELLILDRRSSPCMALSACRNEIVFNYGRCRFRTGVCGMGAVYCRTMPIARTGTPSHQNEPTRQRYVLRQPIQQKAE